MALLREGEGALASDFARWWLNRTGEYVETSDSAAADFFDEGAYSLDELGIDQEDLEWP